MAWRGTSKPRPTLQQAGPDLGRAEAFQALRCLFNWAWPEKYTRAALARVSDFLPLNTSSAELLMGPILRPTPRQKQARLGPGHPMNRAGVILITAEPFRKTPASSRMII